MSKYPQTIDEIEYTKWETFAAFYDPLLAQDVDESNYQQWLADWSYVSRIAYEASSHTYIQYTLDTADKAATETYFAMLDNIQPNLRRAEQQLSEKLLTIDIDRADLQVPLVGMRSDVEIYSEANLPIFVELQKQAAEYNKITGGMSAELDGEQHNVSQLGQLLGSKDRAERERAWHALMGMWQANQDALNELFLQMLPKRTAVAANAGFDDYRAYVFRAKHRFGYTPDDCMTFHDAIEKVVVPAAQRIIERKRQRIGAAAFKPWDYVPEMSIIVDTDDGEALAPFAKQADLVATSQTIFDQLDSELGSYFRTMDEEAMLDLDTRPGKALGGYCSTYPLRKLPYIFMNSTGSADNVQTLFHEAGHAFHAFEAMHSQQFVHQQRANMEFNEVASMAMELLAAPYLTKEAGGFYDTAEAARHRIEHLEGIIMFFPFMSVVDLFQQWLYTHVDEIKSADQLDAKWDELWQRYLPGVDWTGFEGIRASGWHRKLHIFRYPFYYIEYGMAQIGALQVWRNSIADHPAALAQYRQALSLGGTKTLPDLFNAAGAAFQFDVPMVSQLIDLLESTLAELEAQL